MDASFSSSKSPPRSNNSHHHHDEDDDRPSSPLSLPSPTNDNDDSVPLDTKTTSRILNFSPEKFSLLKLFHGDHSRPQLSRPRQDPDYEYATEDDDDDDENDENNDCDDGDGDTVEDHEEDDDEIVVEKIITSRKDTLNHWNQICKTLNTSEIMNGSLWQDQSQLNGSTPKQQHQQCCSSEMVQERFLVKWKDLSYIHCTWETRDVLIDLTTNGVHQLNSFLKRNSNDENVGDELYHDGMKEEHHGIKSFMIIDRILDVKSFGNNMTTCDIVLDKNDPRYEEGMGRTFLIKWCGLPYSESTYEHERDLILMKVEYESHHDVFVRRHTKPNTRQIKDNMAKHDRLVHHLRRLFRTRAQVHDANVNASSSSSSSSSSNMKGYVKELQGKIYRNKGTLREYQAEGVAWMIANYVNGRSSILADEMGLGKTVQTAAFLNTLNDAFGNRGPFLIVAPLSTVIQWQRELSSWTNLNVVLYTGNAADRAMIREYEFAYVCDRPTKLRARQKYLKNCHVKNSNTCFKRTWMVQVLVTTPETMLAKDQDELLSVDWEMLIIDEAHNRLKNRSSKFSMCLRNERFLYRKCLLLTGTPIQNNMDELWTLLNIIDPNVFADHDHFLNRYGNMQGKEQIDELHEVIRPYMLRRLKEDVEKDLPAREETIIEVELTSIQKQYYRALYEKNREFLLQNKGGVDSVNIVMELRKCCNHPFLLDGVEDKAAQGIEIKSKQDEIDFLVKSSGKLVLLDKLLPKLKAGGHRVLIFSQFKIMLNIIEDYLHLMQYSYERIDGSITGKLRQHAIDRFQNKESSFIMLLTTKAGGVGINLTAADTCIIFDSDWNPQNDLQAQARCHRIGQTKDVKVYRFLTKKTYEMRLFHLGSMKLGLDKAVLQGVENKRENSITEQEAERLLRFGAYDVLSEDKNSTNENDSKRFMEEDIDTILLRRTKTQIHDRQISNGFNFSKASFKPVNSDSLDGSLECDVDVDDPDFWTKIFAVPDSKKENFATPISNDEMIASRDYQDNKGACESSGIEEAETKKTRSSVPHEITRNDPVSFSISPDNSDHTNPLTEPDRRTKKSKVSSLQKSKPHTEGTSDQRGRRRKRRCTVDANSSPSKSKRSKPLSSSVMSSPPSSAPISIRRSPRLNPRKCDDVVWSPQSDMSYAVAAGITRRIGVSEKKSTMVKSIPSKVRPRGLPKRRLFSSRTEDNSQDIVGMQKNAETCQDKSPKTASQNAAVMQLIKPSRQIRGDGMVVGNTPFHIDLGTSTKIKCKQKEKLRDDDSSINGKKLSLPNTSTMPREKIDKHSTSARSSVSTTIASSQNERVTTSNPNISKEPLPLEKGMVNTECPTTGMGRASSSADVKSKWDRNTSTMDPSRPNTSRSKSMLPHLQSTKQKATAVQSADSIVQEAQEVNPKQLKREGDESAGMELIHNTLKLKTQRGRKTRRPQYYVPPVTIGKRKRTKIQRSADSNEGSNLDIVPQNTMSMEHEFSRTKETSEQSHNMPPGTIVKLQSKKVEPLKLNSRPRPLSKSDTKQHHVRSKKETKQQSVRRNAKQIVDHCNKVDTTVNQSNDIHRYHTTLHSKSDKQSHTKISTAPWPVVSSKENRIKKVSKVPADKDPTTTIATTTPTTSTRKAPSKRLSHGSSVLERLFAT